MQVPTLPFLDRLLDLVQLASVAGIAHLVRVQMQTRDTVRDIKHTLFGPQGTNGLRGDVTALKDHGPQIDMRVARIADGLNETRRTVQLPEIDYLRGT